MARRILRALGSRYGIAAILLLLVIVVVATARANQDSHSDGRREDGTVDNVEPGASNDGFSSPSAESGEPEEAEDRLPAAAVDTATAFALAWLDTGSVTDQQWHDRLSQYSTIGLREQLAGVSPDSVPAGEIRGDPRTEHTNVEFDTDEGLLILRMTEENGSWLVAGIDFQRP
jgi:hypothetical protein